RVHVRQRDKRARAAQNAFFGNHVAGREAQLADRVQRLFVGRKASRYSRLGRDLRRFIAGAGPAGVAYAAGDAEEIDAACRRRGVKFGSRTVDWPVGRVECQARINESGVNRRAFHLPHPRVGGRRHVLANRLDETVADDDGRAFNDLVWLDNDFAAGQRMNTRWSWPMPRGKNVRAEGRHRQERGELRPETPAFDWRELTTNVGRHQVISETGRPV